MGCRPVAGLQLEEDSSCIQRLGVGFEHDFRFLVEGDKTRLSIHGHCHQQKLIKPVSETTF
jgi:Icc-related predicted phosphoesterase